MRRLFFTILFAATAAAAPIARADDQAKITVRQALMLAPAIRSLDGRPTVAKQGGKDDAVVLTPWEFQSGIVRLILGSDLAIVEAVERTAETVRQGIIREVIKGMPEGTAKIDVGTKEYDVFQRQYDQALDQPAAGTQDLVKIKASDLKLDKNEISISVLAALRPILDVDK